MLRTISKNCLKRLLDQMAYGALIKDEVLYALAPASELYDASLEFRIDFEAMGLRTVCVDQTFNSELTFEEKLEFCNRWNAKPGECKASVDEDGGLREESSFVAIDPCSKEIVCFLIHSFVSCQRFFRELSRLVDEKHGRKPQYDELGPLDPKEIAAKFERYWSKVAWPVALTPVSPDKENASLKKFAVVPERSAISKSNKPR